MRLANRIQTILCDDVRSEMGNKYSLMGIYHRNIVFDGLPATLPKLCLCIMVEGVKVDFREFNITLKCPDAEPIHLPLHMPDDNHIGRDMVLFAMIAPFRAKAAGTAKFEVRLGKNKRPTIIHKFEIQQAAK